MSTHFPPSQPDGAPHGSSETAPAVPYESSRTAGPHPTNPPISRGERPLLKGKSPEELREFVATQLAEREPYYMRAQHIIDINVLDDAEKIENVVDAIRQSLAL